jgi:hypothetical protein
VPGIDCEGKLLLLANELDGGDRTCELARLPRVVLVACELVALELLMLDMLNRLGREKAVGKPLPSLDFSREAVDFLFTTTRLEIDELHLGLEAASLFFEVFVFELLLLELSKCQRAMRIAEQVEGRVT